MSSSSDSHRSAEPPRRKVTSSSCSSVACAKRLNRSAGNPIWRPSVSSMKTVRLTTQALVATNSNSFEGLAEFKTAAGPKPLGAQVLSTLRVPGRTQIRFYASPQSTFSPCFCPPAAAADQRLALQCYGASRRCAGAKTEVNSQQARFASIPTLPARLQSGHVPPGWPGAMPNRGI